MFSLFLTNLQQKEKQFMLKSEAITHYVEYIIHSYAF